MLNSTGHFTGTSSSDGSNLNNIAANIPLPAGSPPPTPNYDEMQHQQQAQHPSTLRPAVQQQYQHQAPLQFYRAQTFGTVGQPMTFAGLAKRPDDVTGATLSQYGPGPGSAIPTIDHHHNSSTFSSMIPRMNVPQMQQAQQYNHYTQGSMLSRPNPMRLTNQPPTYHIAPQPMPMSSHTPRPYTPGFTMAPISTNANLHHQNNIILNRSSAIIHSNNLSTLTATAAAATTATNSNNIICNPTDSRAVSPPLDVLRSQQDIAAPSSSQQQQSDPDATADSNESFSLNILEDVKKRCVTMVMNQMLEEHRSLKHLLHETQKRRETLETEIYDMRRNLPGQGNLEAHPGFIKKKDQEKKCDAKCKELNSAIKYVTNILYTKYQHTVRDEEVRQPLQAPRRNPAPTRAKMSTAAPQLRNVRERPEDEISLLDLEDGDMWCKFCDLRFDTLKEYCDHLHKREHHNNVGASSSLRPWQDNSKPRNRLDKTRTFSRLKSLCSNVGNKHRVTFKVQDIDDIMYPTARHRERMKILNIDRDRGRIDKSDRLFHLKGFDQLVPLLGFYCKLCHMTMCDVTEVEEHLKTYSHNFEHATFVALSPNSEKKFRTDMEKSHKAQHGERESRDHNSERSPSKSHSRSTDPPPLPPPTTTVTTTTATTTAQHTEKIRDSFVPRAQSLDPKITPASRAARVSNDTSRYSARQPYKKPTSRIVDDHEVIAEKFDKRPEERSHDSSSKRNDSDRRANREDRHREERHRDDRKRDDRKRDGAKGDDNDDRHRDEPVAGPSKRADPSKHQTSSLSSSSSSSSRPTSSENKDLPAKRKLPDIVPVSKKSSSGALKRLRHDNSSNKATKDANDRPDQQETGDDDVPMLDAEEEEPPRRGKQKQKKSRTFISSDEDDGELTTQFCASVPPAGQQNAASVAAANKDDGGIELIKIVHRGDPDSPFPDLDLTVTGHTHQDALKSKQLFQRTKVRLNRIDPADYKDWLLPSAELWTRMSQLLTKKEPENGARDKEPADLPLPQRTFLRASGENVPVDVDESSTEDKGDFDMNRLQDFFCDT